MVFLLRWRGLLASEDADHLTEMQPLGPQCVPGWPALSNVLSRTRALRVWSPPTVSKLWLPFLS